MTGGRGDPKWPIFNIRLRAPANIQYSDPPAAQYPISQYSLSGPEPSGASRGKWENGKWARPGRENGKWHAAQLRKWKMARSPAAKMAWHRPPDPRWSADRSSVRKLKSAMRASEGAAAYLLCCLHNLAVVTMCACQLGESHVPCASIPFKNGKRKMENGKWRFLWRTKMENGGLQASESGKWEIPRNPFSSASPQG